MPLTGGQPGSKSQLGQLTFPRKDRLCSSVKCSTAISAAPPTSSETPARRSSWIPAGTSTSTCRSPRPPSNCAITHVLDTHEHADHVSGRLRLAQATGAAPHRPATGERPAPDMVAQGDELRAGALVVTALATPGHRPEHLTFAVADLSAAPDPWMILTGDSLLVGDIARPDLAVEAGAGRPRAARQPGRDWSRSATTSRCGRPTSVARCAAAPG